MAERTDDLIQTRTTLIQRLKNWQDQASWQVFFDTYWRLIYGVAIKGGLTATEAEDVVQETMFSVAKEMPGFTYDRALGSFKAWLLNTTRWRIIEQFRKRKRATGYPPASADPATGWLVNMDDPESLDCAALWDAEWEKSLLEAALANVKRLVDPLKYQVFDFYVNKQWPAEAVAKTFSIPIGQVYLAKHRVTNMIKEEVKRLELQVT